MAPYHNVCYDIPNTNDSLYGVIPTYATKEASVENPGYGQSSQVGWTIYSRDTDPLPVPMITPASSLISQKRMAVSNFTQGGTPKSSVLPLGTSKNQPLPLVRASPIPFTHQDGESEKVLSLLDSTHVRGNNDKETENLTSSTARRIFKETSQSPSPYEKEVEGTLGIATSAGRTVELYGDKKEAGE